MLGVSVEKGERDRALRQALTVCYTGMGAWDVGLGEGGIKMERTLNYYYRLPVSNEDQTAAVKNNSQFEALIAAIDV